MTARGSAVLAPWPHLGTLPGSVALSAVGTLALLDVVVTTPTFKQSSGSFSSSATTTMSTAFSGGVTAGNLLVVAVGWVYGGSVTITDSQGNTYSQALTYDDSVISYSIRIYTAIAGASGANTVTMTFPVGGSFVRMAVHEYTGVTQTVVDSTAAHIAAGLGVVSQTVNISSDTNDLVFSWVVDNNGVPSFQSPATLRQTVQLESTGDLGAN